MCRTIHLSRSNQASAPSENKIMKAPIKLNFRHNLKTMNDQLSSHDEIVVVYGQVGSVVHEIRMANDSDGKITKTCGVYYNAKDCAEYINDKNGV